MKTEILSVLMVITILFSCSAQEEKSADTEVKSEVKTEEANQAEKSDIPFYDKSRPEWKEVEKRIDGYMAAQRDGDYEAFVDHINPKYFAGFTKEDVIASLKAKENSGMVNNNKGGELVKISPLFETDSSDYAVIWYDGTLVVEFTDEFPGNPVGLRRKMEAEYGREFVRYDSLNRDYLIEKEFKFYAERPEGSDKWYFLEEGFWTKRKDIMTYDILIALKGFETEISKIEKEQ